MSFDQLWKQANADAVAKAGDPPAPGAYTAALIDASVFESRAGEPWMKFVWRDVESGHEWEVLYGFRRQGQANFAKASARDLGVDVDMVGGIDGLNEALRALAGTFYLLDVVDGGRYPNSTYIRGRAGDQVGQPVAAQPAASGDDDIPWDTGASSNPDDNIKF
jgi:hypothetical protein